MTSVRVGQGFDVHRFTDDARRPLVLGGVVFEGQRGLQGHSDADAVAQEAARRRVEDSLNAITAEADALCGVPTIEPAPLSGEAP